MLDARGERRARIDEPPSEVEDDPVVDSDSEVVAAVEPTSLADRVRQELREDAATAGLAVDVSVAGGVATLRGTVRDAADVDNALAVAGRVAGIDDVIDELEVAGT